MWKARTSCWCTSLGIGGPAPLRAMLGWGMGWRLITIFRKGPLKGLGKTGMLWVSRTLKVWLAKIRLGNYMGMKACMIGVGTSLVIKFWILNFFRPIKLLFSFFPIKKTVLTVLQNIFSSNVWWVEFRRPARAENLPFAILVHSRLVIRDQVLSAGPDDNQKPR